jgi:ADP-ribosylglycohydrolase
MSIQDFVNSGVIDSEIAAHWSDSSPESRIKASVAAALIAYAAGDAFGVAYEYRDTKMKVDLVHVGSRENWPQGGVSDDTLLSLITIFAHISGDPEKSGKKFLDDLRAALPKLRGLGPTTRAALGIELLPVEKEMLASNMVVPAFVIGNTNGGMMRTSLIGLAYAPSQSVARRAMVSELARATHKDPIAIACAVLVSRLYSEATVQGAPKNLTALLQNEISEISNAPTAVVTGIMNIEKWLPPEKGISLDPLETLSAVYWTVTHAKDALDAYKISCELGGDTDTVAALAAGLFAARDPINSQVFDISWMQEVLWSEIDQLGAAMKVLINHRNSVKN